MKVICLAALSTLLAPSTVLAWAPRQAVTKVPTLSSGNHNVKQQGTFQPLDMEDLSSRDKHSNLQHSASLWLTGATSAMAIPTVASAATAGAPNAVPSALAAYGHYISIMGLIACTCYERFTIKPNMSDDEENGIAIADSLLGVFGLLLVYTGYLRMSQYEKGVDFYLHEPLFWLKVALIGVYGASSFFNTTKIIQRSVAKRTDFGTFEPMNEKLSKRMIQICNAELTALFLIPLTATFMARGVGYSNDIPWQGEAGVSALIFAGLSFKYIKEAVTFEDGPLTEAESAPAP